jgi:hypothetical protein
MTLWHKATQTFKGSGLKRMDIVDEALEQCPPAMHRAEWEARVQLAACYRIFNELGWTELVFNYITVRVPREVLASSTYAT